MYRSYKLTSKKKVDSILPGIKFGRIKVLWRKWRYSLDKSITMDNQKLSPYQEKAIRLWRLALKDENAKLSYNTLGVRHIEKKNLFITYQASGNSNYVMTIMDIGNGGKNLFEIHIPSKHSDYSAELFDTEMDKRMTKIENTKRSIIESDIDKLLEQEEKLLMSKNRDKNSI